MSNPLETITPAIVHGYGEVQRFVGELVIKFRDATDLGLTPAELEASGIDPVDYHNPDVAGRTPTLVASGVVGLVASVVTLKTGLK